MDKFHLYMGNRLETLLDQLGEVYASEPLSSPLTPETILVQSLGMRKWLSLRLAERLGVWTNCRYLFPNSFINETFDALTGGKPSGTEYFERDAMTWAVMRHLPALIAGKGFEDIRAYLGNGAVTLKTWQLASRIAYSFDQYLIYRPDLIVSWDGGGDDHWQARLWLKISSDAPGPHSARRQREFLAALSRRDFVPPAGFPARIAVFGIPALPPFHLEVLAALASHIDVRVFFLDPCREFWGDITSPAEESRAVKKKRAAGLREKDLHLVRGNSLLASTGRMGRDFFDMLMNLDGPQPVELFDNDGTPEGNTILRIVQDDILNLRDRGNGTPPVALTGDALARDRSLAINSCHGPMREVEVLKDYLLDLFDDRDAAIAPDEILVLTPDIELYAPYIEAVFAAGEPRVPYTVADRALRNESALAATFLALLDVAPSRFEASRVVDLLERPLVHRRFGIGAEDLPALRKWIIDTRINWSFDETGKERLGLPPFRGNTWKAGLDRMFLGYAMPGGGRAMFDSILPYDSIEGGDALLLGKLARFISALNECTITLNGERTLAEWHGTLSSLLEKFILAEDNSVDDLRRVEEILAGLTELAEISRFDGPIDFATLRAHLERAFRESVSSRSFLSGAVTFCAMLPMRSIPFRVICMIGMNDSVFPRQDRALAFDLMAAKPRPGDRSLREEDRYLFLEALISAREKLYLSYTGQSIADSGDIPPSILVSELIDCVERTFMLEGSGPDELRKRLVTKHPLQPFSPRYFGGGLFSYSSENCEASAMMGRGEKARPFIEGNVPAAAREGETELAEFLSFFDNPARHLATRGLKVRLTAAGEELNDTEPFGIEGLDRYGIENELCRAAVLGDDLELLARAVEAGGRLPHGTPGALALRRALDESGAVAARVKEQAGGGPLPPLRVTLEIEGLVLRGAIGNLWPGGHVRYRPASMKAKDLLRGWILHLVLCLCRGDGHPARTVVIARETGKKDGFDTAVFPGLEPGTARELLASLARIYLRGATELISLLPQCSFAFTRTLIETGDRGAARDAARTRWRDNEDRGEYTDPYFDLCFARMEDDARFGDGFARISEEIFRPLLAHIGSEAS
jgi:exodeoxyribonuclease V gamma subunit